MKRLWPFALSLFLGIACASAQTIGGGGSAPVATTSVNGISRPDGATVTITAGGVLSSAGGAATSFTPGTTTIGGATAPCLLENSTGTTSACPPVGTGVVSALGTNVGSAGAFVVLGGALGTPSGGTATNLTGTASGLTAGTATAANGLKSATTTVAVDSATAPTSGQVLTATSGTAADWETPSGSSSANPTGTAGPAAVNGSASTFMRSDAAPAVQKASNAQFGIVEVDGTTITASSGVISAVGGSATSFTPGTTTIVGATAPCLLENSTSTTSACPGVGTGVVTALGVNVGSAGSVVVLGGAGGTPSSLTLTNATGLPVGSITGLGTGVATALAVNVGSAGAPVLFNGAGGTPSSITLTNASGTAASLTAGTASALAAGGFANPSATAGPTANNGTATTAMRSDATPAVQKASNAQFGIMEGDGQTITCAITAGVCQTTLTNRTVTTSPTIASTDMGGVIFSNVTGGGTLTVPAISSTVFANGMTATVVNYSASTESVTTTPAILAGGGCVTASGIPAGSAWTLSGNGGATLDCIQTTPASAAGASLSANNAWTAGQAVTPVALTPGTTVSVDAALSNNFTLTPVQSFTLANPSNLKAGQILNFWITQDGTGSRVLTLGTQYQAAGGAATIVLSTAASAKDLLSCASDSTTSMTCALTKAISH